MRKILISVLTTILLFITFGSVTFAWISLPRTNVIEDISFSAKTNTGLEISINGVDYYKELDKSLINELIRNVRLKDVTSMDGVNFSPGYSKNTNVVKNRDYISFDLYFRTNTNQKNVYLVNNLRREKVNYDELSNYKEHTYIISKGIDWMTPRDFLYGPDNDDIRAKGTINKYYGSDAIRLSSIERSPTAKEEISSPINKIFDLSENELRGFGKPYGAIDYFFSEYGEVEIPKGPEVIYGLTEFDEYNKPVDLNDNKGLITTLKHYGDDSYAKGKVTFNIWIEGWDADAFDAILGDKIKIQLAFKSY